MENILKELSKELGLRQGKSKLDILYNTKTIIEEQLKSHNDPIREKCLNYINSEIQKYLESEED